MTTDDFCEIAHSGGQVIIRVSTDKNGRRVYQQTWQHQRPVASGIFAIYALAQGVPVCGLPLGGIGSPMMPAPLLNSPNECFTVGMFMSTKQAKPTRSTLLIAATPQSVQNKLFMRLKSPPTESRDWS
jgi:hypothetical protein